MRAFEKVVRPFQTGDVFDARVLAPQQPAVPGGGPQFVREAVLEWGGPADAKWTEEPPSVTLGFNVEWKEDSSRRVTQQIRVENPDDASQFVMIERIKSTVFKNDQTGEEFPLKMDWKD